MNETRRTSPWLDWAVELQAMGQAGLTYSEDPFDRERFQRLRDIAAEMLSYKTELPLETVKDLFCCETGYQTPKLDTRAAIIQDGKILLVRENTGKWSLPGGWVDVNVSVMENVVKEAREEAGLEVAPWRVVAVQDREKHNRPVYAGRCARFSSSAPWLAGSFRAISRPRPANTSPWMSCRPWRRRRPRRSRSACALTRTGPGPGRR